jgi:hypothetical protein
MGGGAATAGWGHVCVLTGSVIATAAALKGVVFADCSAGPATAAAGTPGEATRAANGATGNVSVVTDDPSVVYADCSPA